MAEQKLPKLPTFAVFRHRRCKPEQKLAVRIQPLSAECKPPAAIGMTPVDEMGDGIWANALPRTALPMNEANLRCLRPAGWVSHFARSMT